jgi:hypothetical protein
MLEIPFWLRMSGGPTLLYTTSIKEIEHIKRAHQKVKENPTRP